MSEVDGLYLGTLATRKNICRLERIDGMRRLLVAGTGKVRLTGAQTYRVTSGTPLTEINKI